MLAVFSSAPLARSVSRSSLKQLMQVLITVLSDDRLASLKDGPQILRAINILMVKVIEMSDQTYVLGWVSAFVYSLCSFFTQNTLNDWN